MSCTSPKHGNRISDDSKTFPPRLFQAEEGAGEEEGAAARRRSKKAKKKERDKKVMGYTSL